MPLRNRLTILGLALLLGALLLPASPGAADQAYHSERLPFFLTDAGAQGGHPDLRSGHVVNIHPNGPVVGALERYMVSGAKPDTGYQVLLQAFFDSCGGTLALPLETATMTTNGNGVAHAKFRFSAADLAPFSGATVQVWWKLVAEGVEAYTTDCTAVSID